MLTDRGRRMHAGGTNGCCRRLGAESTGWQRVFSRPLWGRAVSGNEIHFNISFRPEV